VRRYAAFLPLLIVAGLLAYKWRSAVNAVHTVWLSGALSTRAGVVSLGDATGIGTAVERSMRYFAVIWPALVFGILIGAAVRAFVPEDWLARILGARTLRTQQKAGAAGAPLMLCSCCVAPVFTAVYERSSRLGPSLAVMLAAPSLNPAALVLTWMLFAPRIAAARLLMAAVAVCLGGIVTEHLAGNSGLGSFPGKGTDQEVRASWPHAALTFSRSLIHMLVRTMPALLLGVLCSTLLMQYVPRELFASGRFSGLVVTATAGVAVVLAVPTFFEIPLALGLLAAGAPTALLFAGPAINLPSLLALARSTSWKVAAILATFIWVVATTGGLLLS
jgi:uncharacterized membrane protein YraQ (UPF0718 family)